ncbi:hypothetical protein VE03_09433 [Pseudogymnoascus sp. 23342-1-I1]|nr:hypothetical protein VE03_09433 [Pseudogymnoascus sp. 23342-1-I1]
MTMEASKAFRSSPVTPKIEPSFLLSMVVITLYRRLKVKRHTTAFVVDDASYNSPEHIGDLQGCL